MPALIILEYLFSKASNNFHSCCYANENIKVLLYSILQQSYIFYRL